MLTVGLTGGIGSGKSTAAECFATLGTTVIDADIIAREVVAPATVGLARVVEAFGATLLNPAGALDRAALRNIIFSDPQQRKKLEALLHPLIASEMQARIEQVNAPYCLLCIPLLLESGQTGRVDRILVVDTPHYLQYRRVMARDGLSAAEVAGILRTQVGYRERLARADDLINNDQGQEHVRQRVQELHELYLNLAKTLSLTPQIV